jgi:hypothetical protein
MRFVRPPETGRDPVLAQTAVVQEGRCPNQPKGFHSHLLAHRCQYCEVGAREPALSQGEYHMTRAELALAAIALVATGVTTLDAIKECCTSAQAETQTASPEPTFWDHNGSVMYLVANGSSREFYYQKPRAGMLEVGAHSGSLLFRGEIDNGQYSGTAYIFNPHCGPIPFQVKGPAPDNDERIMLTGQAPRVGRDCRAYESYTSNLEFRRLKPNEVAQYQEQFTAAPPPAVEEAKPDAPSTDAGEVPGAPIPQPSVTHETPSATKDLATNHPPENVAKPKAAGIPRTRPFATHETPSQAKDLDNYIWGAMFIVAIMSLFGFAIARILIKQGGVWDKVMR